MALNIEYIDKLGSVNLYAAVYNSNGLALNNIDFTFGALEGSNWEDVVFDLTQDVERTTLYTASITNTSGFTKGKYSIEVWQKIGASPSLSADTLLGCNDIFWDGTKEQDTISMPYLDGQNYLGQKTVGSAFTFTTQLHNEFGNVANASGNPTYKFTRLGISFIPDITGAMAAIQTGFYYATRTLTAGLFSAGDQCEVRILANTEKHTVAAVKAFQVVEAIGGNTDVRTQLGYLSGYITGSPTSSSFITTISGHTNDWINGSILRIADSNSLINGQARIVLDSQVSTKRVWVNKPFTGIPSSGTFVLVFPIGGELGLE